MLSTLCNSFLRIFKKITYKVMIMKYMMKYTIMLGCGLLFASMRGADQVNVPVQAHEQTVVLGLPSESVQSLVERDPQFEESNLHHISSGELMVYWGLLAAQMIGLAMVVYYGEHA